MRLLLDASRACAFDAWVRGNNFPYHPVAVVCICHPNRETGRLSTKDIQTVMIRQQTIVMALSIIQPLVIENI